MSKNYYYEVETTETTEPVLSEEIGCGFCWDKRKQRSKELFFLDNANNMRVCKFCPNCGRAYGD